LLYRAAVFIGSGRVDEEPFDGRLDLVAGSRAGDDTFGEFGAAHVEVLTDEVQNLGAVMPVTQRPAGLQFTHHP
ncbi:MAG: hypothetical protein Q7U34_08570, partial [Anaerolineales bacterium]|nr:hypothetical protein [Anaerolineales bacterium]